VFLIGGPAFSGTTLLALLLNQGDVVCLDEPDFHDPSQRHRGIPVLQELFPDRAFPRPPEQELSWQQATRLIEECERAIRPCELGMKTCDRPFVGYAAEYRRLGYPVICIVRDIRDALVRPLPPWLSEERLNRNYRLVWGLADALDLVVRYEDLIADAAAAMGRVSAALGRHLEVRSEWALDRVHPPMLKLDRHELLRTGAISSARVGVWRTSPRTFAEETHETAAMMGYERP
jgi:hypothetical protein